MSLACQAGLQTWLCATFRLAIVLYNHGVFGWVALVTALLNLVRPSIVLIAVALAFAGFGMVLHNAELADIEVGELRCVHIHTADLAAVFEVAHLIGIRLVE